MTDKHHGETAEYWWSMFVEVVAERDALKNKLDRIEGRRMATLQEMAMNSKAPAFSYNQGGNAANVYRHGWGPFA